MKVAIGSDHAGFKLKQYLVDVLKSKGMEILDVGPFSEERVDYPDFAHPVAEAVESGKVDMGLIMCGSGNGINMAANKHAGIRSALCWNPEIAKLAREHNDANVLALPARFLTEEQAREILEAFLAARFEGGRHEERIRKIPLHS
ncbi:MAG: ribose 5-phosphate isomerase B [Flavobacteriales bacterium]|nr:ribose 5-phosphate isomerase B [Flavobacteriales bacterium]MCB9449614.1 ribose 5-phosphate isomerase B [Flavobacteriales bacterium]